MSYSQEVFSALISTRNIAALIEVAKLNIFPDTLSISTPITTYPHIKKFMFNDGSEDEVLVTFRSEIPPMRFRTDDNFGFEVSGVTPQQSAEQFANFLEGLLSGQATVIRSEYPGYDVVNVRVDSKNYRGSNKNLWPLPKRLLEILANKQRL